MTLWASPVLAWGQYVSRSGNVIDDGGGSGPLSDLSMIAGLVGATCFAYLAVNDRSNFWGVIGMAWMGLCAGVIAGTLLGFIF